VRLLAILVALPLFLTACGGTQESSSGGSGGLQGTVSRGPITPTCSKDEPCSAPADGVELTFSKEGKVVAQVETDGDGSYKVRLEPGRYFVLGPQPVKPQQVDVAASGFRRVDFAIDTKIR
jgi:hypothetical protein